jgi:uncharacterized membrane protein
MYGNFIRVKVQPGSADYALATLQRLQQQQLIKMVDAAVVTWRRTAKGRSHCPVWVFHGSGGTMFTRILVPLDGSAIAEKALPHARALRPIFALSV